MPASPDAPELSDRLAEVRRRARLAMALLFVYVGTGALGLVMGVVIAALHAGSSDLELALALERAERLEAPLSILVFVATAVAFARWKLAAYRLIPAFGGPPPSFTPGWAVGSYFVPIVNLYRPYQIMGEIWEESEPDGLAFDGDAGGRWLIRAWWGAWLLTQALAQVSRLLDGSASASPDARDTAAFVLFAALMGAGVLAALVVRMVDARQQARGAEALLGPGALLGTEPLQDVPPPLHRPDRDPDG
jgi:hypothetical protein